MRVFEVSWLLTLLNLRGRSWYGRESFAYRGISDVGIKGEVMYGVVLQNTSMCIPLVLLSSQEKALRCSASKKKSHFQCTEG